ncbi:gamma subclass chorismate mutase AroQ [Nocardia sp. NPDC057440]|uniref:gamma subclass chorismate mutase AroQ n=1 Tax=Nocardia sp. NPDC057440 TaxID=3346134 RepID=UPI003671B80C
MIGFRAWRSGLGGGLLVLLSVALAVLVSAGALASPAEPRTASLHGLVELVADRLDTADAVAGAKWATAQQLGTEPSIDDPGREAQVYDDMAHLGAGLDLPENWIRQVFSGQIEASKIVQRGLVARWRFDPAAAPAAAPDLSKVRPRIDRLNVDIVEQLAAQRAELAAPDCVERLAPGVFGVLTSGRADALHQAALIRAVTALCAP